MCESLEPYNDYLSANIDFLLCTVYSVICMIISKPFHLGLQEKHRCVTVCHEKKAWMDSLKPEHFLLVLTRSDRVSSKTGNDVGGGVRVWVWVVGVCVERSGDVRSTL